MGKGILARLRGGFGAYSAGLPMRLRLFVFFMVLVVAMTLGVVGVLLGTGFLDDGDGKAIESELAWRMQNLEMQCAEISVQALRLARTLSENIENRLAENGLTPDDLRLRSDLLRKILHDEYDSLFFAFQRVKSSGVFVVLGATAGKTDRDRFSRAGLFIKNHEPGILRETSSAITLLRGSPETAVGHGIVLDPEWALEFDVEDAPWYALPQKAAAENPAVASRLYCWTPAASLAGTDYRVMLCSVPLVDSNGGVFGVCGIEFSDALFKQAFTPANAIRSGVFCVLAPTEGQMLDMAQALVSWRYVAKDARDLGALRVAAAKKWGFTYTGEGGAVFAGLHEPVNLYPPDSPFAGQSFVLAAVEPLERLGASSAGRRHGLVFFSLLFVFLGAVFSVAFSRWYTRPVLRGLDAIRSGSADGGARTKVPEIDDLIEFLYAQPGETGGGEERTETAREGAETGEKGVAEELPPKEEPVREELPSGLFDAFVENIKTLSRAEKNVFDLYLEGHSAREIAELLSLSINTIKTHNRRIFMKLNVSSRKELLTCVRMLQEAGRTIT